MTDKKIISELLEQLENIEGYFNTPISRRVMSKQQIDILLKNEELINKAKKTIEMKKVIVKSWTQVPFTGLRISNFKNQKVAFDYAESEYFPFGYNLAYWCEDTKDLFLKRN